MKKLMLAVCLFATVSVLAHAPIVNEKVLKAFNATFTHATDVVWHESQNRYEARFIYSEIISRAIYDKEGNLLSTTRYYKEEKLPTNILVKLKSQYTGKSIFGITEVTAHDEVVYHITLEDEKNWYRVVSDSWANIDLVKKLKKG